MRLFHYKLRRGCEGLNPYVISVSLRFLLLGDGNQPSSLISIPNHLVISREVVGRS